MIRAARIGTGVWVAAAVLGVVALDWFTGTVWGTAALFTVGSCLALREVFAMLRGVGIEGYERWAVFSLASAMAVRAAEAPLRLTGGEARELSLGILAFGFIGPVMREVATARTEVEVQPETIRRVGATCFALAYVGFLATFLLELRMMRGAGGSLETGLQLALLLVACVKIGDTAAYFVGRTIGRTKLSPVSPKKTWEGSIASVTASVATAALLGGIFGFDLRVMIGFGLVADLAGQGGDLVESWIKRALGAKDSATTFGEMGGFLDMADAILLAAPPAYLWSELLIARGG